jgi:hypothetical protein
MLILASLLMGQATKNELPPYLYTAAPQYEASAWTHGAERFPAGARLVLRKGAERRDAVPGFFASADAAVSYDGQRILFAGRAARTDRWQIWESDLNGGAPKRVVSSADNCLRPLYLPDGRIVYTRVIATGSVLEVLSPDGKKDVLTSAPGWYLTDDVLHDGRILFESRDELFTVYPDGTGVESLRCDHGPKRSGARQISSGDVIFSASGQLARYTSALSSQEKLPATRAELTGPVAEVAADRWLVAARPGPGGVYSIDQTGPGGGALVGVDAPAGINAVEPVVVSARVPPREFPSGLVATRTSGNLLCLDVRESKTRVSGEIRSVRIYTQDEKGGAQLLGQTTPATDGSFYVEVPANRPIRMELVDASGTRLQGEEHWFWMRPSEQRICVGCHAGPERAPENKVPEILNQILVPVRMTGDKGLPQ